MKLHIQINSKLKKRIAKLGDVNQNYEEVIKKIVTHCEICDRWWVDK